MKKNGTGPSTTGTIWTDAHKSFAINHHRRKKVLQFKWRSSVIMVTVILLMSLNEAQSTLSVANRLARNIQKDGSQSVKVSDLF